MKTNRLLLLLIMALIFPAASSGQLIYNGLGDYSLSQFNARIRVMHDTMYVPTTSGIFKKSLSDSNSSWLPAGLQGEPVNDFALANDSIIVSVINGAEGNTVYISTDYGHSFYNSTNGFGGTGANYFPGARVAVNPDNYNEILAMSGQTIAMSVDFGDSWEIKHMDWGFMLYQSTVLEYHPLNNSYIYAGGELPVFASYLALSFDGGNTWEMSTSIYQNNDAVNCIEFHPQDVDIQFVGLEGRIARSEDKGVNWTDVYFSPNYEYIYSIVVDLNDHDIVYAAGGVNGINDVMRIFRSTDGGIHWDQWQEYNLGDDKGAVVDMMMHNNSLYILTHTAGMYKLDLDTPPVSDGITPLPQISLYPNPADDYITLSGDYNCGNYIIQILNSAGLLVKEVEVQDNTPVDISGLRPGLYLINQPEHNQVLRFIKK